MANSMPILFILRSFLHRQWRLFKWVYSSSDWCWLCTCIVILWSLKVKTINTFWHHDLRLVRTLVINGSRIKWNGSELISWLVLWLYLMVTDLQVHFWTIHVIYGSIINIWLWFKANIDSLKIQYICYNCKIPHS